MKNLFTKLASCLLLAIYIVNPLHAGLHSGHVHGTHSGCHAEKHSESDDKFTKSYYTHSHECYLCQNNQDRNHFAGNSANNQNVITFPPEKWAGTASSQISSSPDFYIDSRGPPALS